MAKKPDPKPVLAIPSAPAPSRRMAIMILLVILAAAAALRMVNLSQSPPGMSQDEGQNIWDAWSMLKTGMDQVGDRWPIFYSKCFGGNRSTLQLYYLIPFQAVGGLSVEVARFSSAFSGVLAVLLVYLVGARLFSHGAGLLAAAIMAFNPWHIQQSRWAHEATLVPTLVLLPIAILLWAGFPLDDSQDRKPRPLLAGLAGLAAGVACYGYPVVRLFLPLMLLATAVVLWRPLVATLKTPRGRAAVGAFALAMAVTFGPLVYKHMTDPGMNKRGGSTKIWSEQDTFGEKVSKVAERYPAHFGPDFLFDRGDLYELQSPPGQGLFHWYSLPLMVLGAGFLVTGLRRRRAARVLLVWLLLYPIPDCITQHNPGSESSLHALRTLVGLPALVLLAALGAWSAGEWLWRKKRPALYAAAAVMVASAAFLNVRYLKVFYGDFNRRSMIYHSFQTDVLQASQWLRPRLNDYDAVFYDSYHMNMPFLTALIGLDYPPQQWFADRHIIATAELDKYHAFRNPLILPLPPGYEWDSHILLGKIAFMNNSYWPALVQELQQNGRKDRVLFFLPPAHAEALRSKVTFLRDATPVHNIVGPVGQVVLQAYEVSL